MVDTIYSLRITPRISETASESGVNEFLNTQFQKIYNFLNSAFEGFDGVSIGTITTDDVKGLWYSSFIIYLNLSKTFYIHCYIDKIVDSGNYFITKFDIVKDGIIHDSFSTNINQGTGYLYFYKSNYGVFTNISRINANTTASTYSEKLSAMSMIFVPDDVSTLIYGKNENFNSATNSTSELDVYVLSENHTEIEIMTESATHMCRSCGDQRMSMVSAFSYITPINCPHLYRVIGIPNTSYPKGKIKVANKYMIWMGRYALEVENEE